MSLQYESIYNNPTVNIAIIGCISSGKSTLMNSLFAETYSSMHIKRTTMSPQVYCTSQKLVSNPLVAHKIKLQNDDINKKLYDMGKIASCEESVYQVPPMPEIFKDTDTIINGLVDYKIYDIPGLNDSATRETFYKYIRDNFFKFDIIIYNIDINSGLNTTDELDILTLIKTNINIIKRDHQREPRLVVICNKMDDLSLKAGELISSTEEIEEMYAQVVRIINKNFGPNIQVIKYSASSTYMYRYIKIHGKNFRPEHIDKTYIDRIGIDNFGRVGWSKKSTNKSIDELWILIKDCISDNLDGSLILSGFCNLSKVIGKEIIHRYIYDIMYSKINYLKNHSEFKQKYDFIDKLNIQLKCTFGLPQLYTYLNEYLCFLDSKYLSHIAISITTKARMEKYYNILCELLTLPLIKSKETIIQAKIQDYKEKLTTFNLIKYENSEYVIDNDNISTFKETINEAIKVCGIERISEPKLINGLCNIINIEIGHKIFQYLRSVNMSDSIIINMYSWVIVNHLNTLADNQVTKLITNYINLKYYKTENEIWNYMSAKITRQNGFLPSHKEELFYSKIYESVKVYKQYIDEFDRFFFGDE
jgi:GTPase SAR1 family protein